VGARRQRGILRSGVDGGVRGLKEKRKGRASLRAVDDVHVRGWQVETGVAGRARLRAEVIAAGVGGHAGGPGWRQGRRAPGGGRGPLASSEHDVGVGHWPQAPKRIREEPQVPGRSAIASGHAAEVAADRLWAGGVESRRARSQPDHGPRVAVAAL